METDDDAEKEIRILNADKFKPIRIEIWNILKNMVSEMNIQNLVLKIFIN